jgi:hypothetical protein
MELLAVRTARLIAFLNAEELNPEGRPIAHDFFNAFTERYNFLKRPMTADEILDSQDKGITFETGKLGDVGIDKVTLFNWGVVVETSASTDASENVLQDILSWGAKTFGLSNRPTLITQRGYVSELVFSSNMRLPSLNPSVTALATKITNLVASYRGESLPYEVVGFGLAFDPTKTKQTFTPFRVERLADSSFASKKYYSGAPLKTADHIQLIEDLEAALTREPTPLSLDDE